MRKESGIRYGGTRRKEVGASREGREIGMCNGVRGMNEGEGKRRSERRERIKEGGKEGRVEIRREKQRGKTR